MAKKGIVMGKAARNERFKIMATFYNNIAVGFIVAGVLVPSFLFVIRVVIGSPVDHAITLERAEAVLWFLGIAILAGISFHTSARRIVSNIED
jgi:hypothetical protein